MKSYSSIKTIDIGKDQLNPNTLEYLQNSAEPAYRDQVLKEHIYGDLSEDLPEFGLLNCIRVDIEDISDLMRKTNANYFRIVFP